jgi:hypothetical protein
MALIYTTKGEIDRALLTEEVEFRVNAREYVIRRRLYLGSEMVREDAHVVIKPEAMTVEAAAVAAAIA